MELDNALAAELARLYVENFAEMSWADRLDTLQAAARARGW